MTCDNCEKLKAELVTLKAEDKRLLNLGLKYSKQIHEMEQAKNSAEAELARAREEYKSLCQNFNLPDLSTEPEKEVKP